MVAEGLREGVRAVEESPRVPVAESAVETRGLGKRYGRSRAVDGLDLNVRRGEVYGFLGPNGAGKTTTLRMLLGLIRPTEGLARVLGGEPGTPDALARVGAMVESPAFYPFLSGRDNLRGLARLSGVTNPKGRAGEVLELVGLSERAKDRYKKYSLGMKQRLGVGAALLKDPELLILDEPTNGLDPKGISEMRGLIRSLGRGERTVLLSSHLMGEVEQACDRVGILDRGHLVAEGTVEELRGRGGLMVRADPPEEAATVARVIQGVAGVEVRDGTIWLDADPELAPEISHKLLSAGIRVREVRPARRSLEEVFLHMTDGSEKEGA